MAKFYYNGVLLPEIPKDVLAEYPYCWIRKNTTSGNYDLVFGKQPWYYNGTGMYCQDDTSEPFYIIPITSAENATEWVFNKIATTFFGIDTVRTVMWSNHDIPNGSATATEIYFAGSKPVPEANLVIADKLELTSIADSIRAKTGKTEHMYISQMPDAIREIGNSGNEGEEETLATIIGHEPVDIYNESVTKIRDYGFYYNSGVRSVEFPNCETIGSRAFMSCASLTTVDFPKCTMMSSGAFMYCKSLTSANFPNCITIGVQTFDSCPSLTSVNFPACTTISEYAFRSCTALTSVDFPNCTTIKSSAFYSCTSLTSISFPKCTTIEYAAFLSCRTLSSIDFPTCTKIEGQAFYSCSSLTSINFPVCTSIGQYAFSGCSSLTTVDFPVCITIGSAAFLQCRSLVSAKFPACTKVYNDAFRYCSALTSLTLGASSVATLSNTNTFVNTPMSNSTYTGSFGSIYVPASLVDSYKAASNWSVYADRITAIVE